MGIYSESVHLAMLPQELILIFAWALSCTGFNTDASCCTEKIVGDVQYSLQESSDTTSFECLDDCVYEQVGEPGSRFCFKKGNLLPTCQGSNVHCGSNAEDKLNKLAASGNKQNHVCCPNNTETESVIETCVGQECANIHCMIDGGCIH